MTKAGPASTGREPVRRRRRVRTSASPPATADNDVTSMTTEVSDEAAAGAVAAEPDSSPVERVLRGLVGSGSSQVNPAAALRARDAARPTAEHLARAERELVVVRRHWTPRD